MGSTIKTRSSLSLQGLQDGYNNEELASFRDYVLDNTSCLPRSRFPQEQAQVVSKFLFFANDGRPFEEPEVWRPVHDVKLIDSCLRNLRKAGCSPSTLYNRVRALKIASRFTYATFQDGAELRPEGTPRLQAGRFQLATIGCHPCPRREPTAGLEGSSGRRFQQQKCQEALPTNCAPGPGLSRCWRQTPKGWVPLCYEDGPCVVSVVGGHPARCIVHAHHIPGPGGVSPTPRRFWDADRKCNTQDGRQQRSGHHRARVRFEKGPARLCHLCQVEMPKCSSWRLRECQRPPSDLAGQCKPGTPSAKLWMG